jgi:hypothetical protein
MPNHRFDRCDGQHKMVDCSANLGVGLEQALRTAGKVLAPYLAGNGRS